MFSKEDPSHARCWSVVVGKCKCGGVNVRKDEACVVLSLVNKRRSMSQPNDDDDFEEYVTDSDDDGGGDDDDLANERDGIDLDSSDEQSWEAHHGLRHLFVSVCKFVDISGGTRVCMGQAFY